MKALHFNFKDLFRAARIAFSFQRIWVNGIGLLVGYLIFLVVSYLGLLISGYNFSYLWGKFGLLPCAFALGAPWYSQAIYILGLLFFLAIVFLTNTAVARIVYMVLRDELFYTWTQAYKFAFRKWVSVLGAMLTFIFIIVLFVVGALVMGLLGRIPIIGELGTAVMIIPYIFASLILFFVVIVFGVGTILIPAIIATSDEDALGGVFQSFSITFNQPWRLFIYSTLVAILEVVGMFLFAVALKVSYRIFIGLFSIGMGEKFVQIKSQALHLLDRAVPVLYGWLQALPGDIGKYVYFTTPHPAIANLPVTYDIAAYIFAIFFLLIGGAVLAYGEATGNAGMTLIYIILYKLHENENLLEREDEELKEEEEEAEEPSTEGSEEKSGEAEKKEEAPEKE